MSGHGGRSLPEEGGGWDQEDVLEGMGAELFERGFVDGRGSPWINGKTSGYGKCEPSQKRTVRLYAVSVALTLSQNIEQIESDAKRREGKEPSETASKQ